MNPSSFEIRVYWEDTDAGGVVYYANYLKFAERARTEALRNVGIVQAELLHDHGIAFVVRHAGIEFLKPARLDDLLTIETDLTDIGSASLTLRQTVRRGHERLAEVAVKLGTIDARFRPCRMPAPVRDAVRQAFA